MEEEREEPSKDKECSESEACRTVMFTERIEDDGGERGPLWREHLFLSLSRGDNPTNAYPQHSPSYLDDEIISEYAFLSSRSSTALLSLKKEKKNCRPPPLR